MQKQVLTLRHFAVKCQQAYTHTKSNSPPLLANHLAIHALSASLRDFLHQSHERAAATDGLPACRFEVVSSAWLAGTGNFEDTTLSLYLYRISTNHHLRNLRQGPPTGPLGLDLHYLLTVWGKEGDTAQTEQTLLGWVLRELHYHPWLDASVLRATGQWAADETVALLPADLSVEDLVRLWDAVNRPYRLSCGLLARVVRLAKPAAEFEPVVAARLTFTDNLEERAP